MPGSIFDSCAYISPCLTGSGSEGTPLAAGNLVAVAGPDIGQAPRLTSSCGGVSEYNCPVGNGDANNYAAAVYLYYADLTLEQNVGPTATNVSGELATAPVVSGTSDVAFSASDAGAGVYQAVFTIDGHIVQRTVVDRDGGRCADVGGTTDGSPAFLYLQPCLPSVSVDVPFDTSAVANGAHRLLVTVTDAAGNSAPVLDRELAVSNIAGSGAASDRPAKRIGRRWAGFSRRVLAWDDECPTHGALRPSRDRPGEGLTGAGGQPIAGAQIDVQASPAYAGAATVALTGPRTAGGTAPSR